MSEYEDRRTELAARFRKAERKRNDKTKQRKRWRLSRDLMKDAAPSLGVEPKDIQRFWGDAFDAKDVLSSYKSLSAGVVDHVFVYHKTISQSKLVGFLLKPDSFTSSALLKTWAKYRDVLQMSEAGHSPPWLLFRVPSKHTYVLKAYSASRPTAVPHPRIIVPSSLERTPLEIIDVDTLTKERS